LGDVALLGSAREIQDARDGEEVADLMHFHGGCVPSALLGIHMQPAAAGGGPTGFGLLTGHAKVTRKCLVCVFYRRCYAYVCLTAETI
jgi:hypothetical protein